MSYLGDVVLGQTIEWTFTTRQFSTGAPFALAGTPSLEAYETGNTTPITAGITLTTNYNSVTGLNHVSIVASGGNGFAAQNDISVVIAAGTVDSVSVVGETIGSFSIENRSALRPTTAGRTLDVSAGGEAGLDWANIGSPTTAQNLSSTNIGVDQVVASVSGAVGSVTGAVGSVTGNVGGSVDSVVDPVTVGTNNDKTDYVLSAAGVTAVQSGLATASALGTVDTVVDAIKLKTDNLPSVVKKNTALPAFMFLMVDSADHVTGATGLTVTATRSLDGAAFGACANAVAEISGGVYSIDLADTDLNGDTVTLRFTATGADARVIHIVTNAV